MTIHDVERQLEQLSRDEKALVFQRLALDLVQSWPGVEKTPGVQGGDACVVRTRIPVWTLESYRRLGWDDERILANFPTLRQADLVYAWLYAEANQDIRREHGKPDVWGLTHRSGPMRHRWSDPTRTYRVAVCDDGEAWVREWRLAQADLFGRRYGLVRVSDGPVTVNGRVAVYMYGAVGP